MEDTGFPEGETPGASATQSEKQQEKATVTGLGHYNYTRTDHAVISNHCHLIIFIFYLKMNSPNEFLFMPYFLHHVVQSGM